MPAKKYKSKKKIRKRKSAKTNTKLLAIVGVLGDSGILLSFAEPRKISDLAIRWLLRVITGTHENSLVVL